MHVRRAVRAARAIRAAEAVAAALFTLYVMWPYIVPGRPVVSLDGLIYSGPNMRLTLDALADGRLPLWNDTIFGGVTHAGNPQSAVFSPTKLLVLGLDPTRAVNVLTAVHLALLAAGMFALCAWRLRVRPPAAFVATALAVGCGAAASKTLQFEQIAVVAWVPLLLALIHWAVTSERPWPALGCTVLATACWITGGHPQIVYVTAPVVVVWTVAVAADRRAWRRIAHTAAAAALGTLVALPHLALAARASSDAALDGGRSLDELSRQGFSLLTRDLVPALLGDVSARNQAIPAGGFEATAYVGAAALALAVIGVVVGARTLDRRWTTVALAGVGGVSLLFALGPRTPLFRAAYRVVPGFDLARVPARWVLPASLCIAVLAALGLDSTLVRSVTTRARVWVLGALGATAAAVTALAVRYEEVLPDAEVVTGWIVAAVVTAGAWVAATTVGRSGSVRWVPAAAAVVAALVVTVELGLPARHSYARGLQLDAAPEHIDDPVLSFLEEHPEGRTIAATFDEFGDPTYLTTGLRPNANTLFGIRSVDGYDGGVQVTERWAGTFAGVFDTFDPQLTARAQIDGPMAPGLWARLGVRYAVLEPRGLPASTLLPGWRGPLVSTPFEVWENPAWRSSAMAWFATTSAPDATAAAAAIAADPASAYLQVEGSADELRCRAAEGSCDPVAVPARRSHPGEVTITATLDRPAIVVVDEQHDAGWRAEVDGVSAEVVPVDGLSIGVAVPAGTHTVRFVYRPSGLGLMLLVSGLATLIATALIADPLVRVARARRAARLSSTQAGHEEATR